jgi:hypothetical protein
VADQDLIEVYSFEAGGYDWSEIRVYRHPRVDGAFFTHDDAGCSCYGYEPPGEADIAAASPMKPGEVIREFMDWWDRNRSTHCGSEGTKVREIETLALALR